MNSKKYFYQFVVTLVLFFSLNTYAAFTLNGTRFIYDEGRKNISVEVTNHTDKLFGGQIWVDNVDDSTDVFFIPTPNIFKLEGDKKQLVRLMNVNANLPKDRESIFWLNVQEIPPAPEPGQNVLAVALNTQVKLIYRPTSISEKREEAEQNLIYKNGVLKNPTPYYFAITAVQVDGKGMNFSNSVEQELTIFAPFSEINLGKILSGKVSIEAIDDYGARRIYQLN